jgi:diguanylate cyclase (GGDEF)-like protein/PAS domain S-box-containing protein
MTSLDIRTLSFLAMVSSLLLALGSVLVNRVISKDPSLRLWAMGASANGAAFVLLALRGIVPDLVSIVVANTLIVVGSVWLYLGNRQFRGLKTGVPWYWFVAGSTATLLFYFTYWTPSLSARIVTLSAATAIILFPCAYVLVGPGNSRRDRWVRWFVAAAFLMTAILLAVRAVVTVVLTSPGQDFMLVANPIHTFSLVAGICLNAMLGVGLPLLVSGRMHWRLKDSEDRYRTLYTRTPAIMHSITADGSLIHVSDLWLKTLGYTRDEVIGRKSSDFLTEDSRHLAIAQVLPEFLRTGSCADISYQFITKDGRVLDMRLSAIAEKGADASDIQSLAVMNDVTARNRIDAALVQSELQFRGAFESAAHGMALVSTEGRFTQVNAALCDMLGYSEADLLSTDYQTITHPDDLAADEAHVLDLLHGVRAAYQMEKRYLHKTGRTLWVQLSVSLVRTKDGIPVHFVAQIQDITQNKDASERLQTLLDTASDGIHVLDEQGNIVQFSLSFARMLGYTAQDMAGMNVRDWDAQIPADELIPTLHALILEPRAFETRHRRKDGSMIDVEINAKGVDLDGRAHLYASSRDVTDRKLNQQRLEQLLAEQKAMLENELMGIVKVRDRTIIWANPAFEKMLGYASGELSGRPTRQSYKSESAYRGFGDAAYPALATGSVFRSQIEQLRKDGQVIWVDVSGSTLNKESGESLWGFVDVTERRMQERTIWQSEQRMELALDGADLGLWDLDILSGRVANNPRLFTMAGYFHDELDLNTSKIRALIHPDDLHSFKSAFSATLNGEVPNLDVEYRLHHKNGHWLWVRCRGKVVERDEQGRAIRMAGTNADISRRKANEDKIHELAFFDPLTHLPNRRLLLDRLGLALPSSGRHNTYGAILFLDLDNFKILNDTKGHEFGDILLVEVARRLLTCVRAEDTVSRLGGDEFVITLENLNQEEKLAATEAGAIGAKILDAISAVYALPQFNHCCTCSIGIALFKGNALSSGEIIKRADIAMYQAKAAGRNAIAFFQSADQP